MEAKIKEVILTLIETMPELKSVLFDFVEPWKIDLAAFTGSPRRDCTEPCFNPMFESVWPSETCFGQQSSMPTRLSACVGRRMYL